VALGHALGGRDGVAGDGLTPPRVKDNGHLPGEGLPPLGELSAAAQGLDHLGGAVAPAGELDLSPLPDRRLRRALALLAPEAADPEERVRPLEQAARGPRIGTPWRVVFLAVVRPRQRDEVEQRAELEVLRLVNERLRARVRIWLPGRRHGAERLW
jgi:hypothetical protein